MPTYVYKNLTTGDTFELYQRITEPALTEHPQTGDPVKRVVQPVGIAFKGSGFYVNDSRSGGAESAPKAAPEGGAKTAAKAAPEGGTASASESTSNSASKSAPATGASGD